MSHRACENYLSLSHVTCFIMRNAILRNKDPLFFLLGERRGGISAHNRSISYSACVNSVSSCRMWRALSCKTSYPAKQTFLLFSHGERREETSARNLSISYRACASYELIKRRIKPKLASLNTTLSSVFFANCKLASDISNQFLNNFS